MGMNVHMRCTGRSPQTTDNEVEMALHGQAGEASAICVVNDNSNGITKRSWSY